MLEDNPKSLHVRFDKLLTAQEGADILNIGVSTMYQLIQHGEIPSVQIGSTRRIRPVDLRNFIESRIVSGESL